MFKVNNRNTRKRCKIFLKLTIKTLKQRHSDVLIVTREPIPHRFPMYSPSASIADFEQVNASWDDFKCHNTQSIKPQNVTAGVCNCPRQCLCQCQCLSATWKINTIKYLSFYQKYF